MGAMLDDPRAQLLVGELAALTGEDVTEAIVKALEERIEREREQRRLIDDLKTIAHDYYRFAAPATVRTIDGSMTSTACRSDRPQHVP